VCVEAWRLAATMVIPGGSMQTVRPATPLPPWFCAAIGIDDDGRRECLNRCLRLPGPYMQAVLAPVTAMCLSSRHASARLFLTLADRVLFPRLHSSWCCANLAATAAALLSAATHSPSLLLSAGPLAALCCSRIVSAVNQPLPSDSVLDSVRGNPAAASAIVGVDVRLTLLRLLEGLLAVTGTAERTGHVDALAAGVVECDYTTAAAVSASRFTGIIGGGSKQQRDSAANEADAAGVRDAVSRIVARLCVSEIEDGRCRRIDILRTIANANSTEAFGGVSDDDADAPSGTAAPQAVGATAALCPLVLRQARQALSALAKASSPTVAPAESAAASLLGLLLEGTLAAVRRATATAVAFLPGAEAGAFARDAAAAARCRAIVDQSLLTVVAALDSVYLPCMAAPHTVFFRYGPGTIVAACPSLLEILTAAAECVTRVLVPLSRATYHAETGGLVAADAADAADGVAAAVLELVEQAATALECLLPHHVAVAVALQPAIAEPASGAPPAAHCTLVLPLLSAVVAVSSVRGSLGLPATPLLRDAVNHHALIPIAATCASVVLVLKTVADHHAPPPVGLVECDGQMQFLAASATAAAALIDGADRRVANGKAAAGAAPRDCTTVQRTTQELLADVREFGLDAIKRCNAEPPPPHLGRTVAALRFCLQALGMTPGDAAPLSLSRLRVGSATLPLWLRLPLNALGPKPPRRTGQPIRSVVVSGKADPLHITVAYCLRSLTSVDVAVTLVNRSPVCISQVLIDMCSVQPSTSALVIAYVGAGSGSGPLNFAQADSASPAAAPTVVPSGAGQWAVAALAPLASAAAHCAFSVHLSDASAGVAEVLAATLGGFAVRVTAAVNPLGDVDTANDATRQRRRDADALLAYVRQRKSAKRNAAGAAVAAVTSDVAGTQARDTHCLALHALPPLGISLCDALAPPPPLGPSGTAAAAAWLRACAGSGVASRVINACALGLLADARGDLDPRPIGGVPTADYFALAERRAGDDDLASDIPRSLFCTALCALWLGIDAACIERAGTGATAKHHGTVPPLLSVEMHAAGFDAADAPPTAIATQWLCVVRATPGHGSLAAAVLNHAEFPVFAAAILEAGATAP
jgi:hypothetical protein